MSSLNRANTVTFKKLLAECVRNVMANGKLSRLPFETGEHMLMNNFVASSAQYAIHMYDR